MKKIAVASDHAGARVKKQVLKDLDFLGLVFEDLSVSNSVDDDYPDFASRVASVVSEKKVFGILSCGSGIGVSIVANKYNGVRAALCKTPRDAELSRKHNDANILVISGKTPLKDVRALLKKFFSSEFEKGRHLRRVNKIKKIELELLKK